jgi:hypothetical protein
VPIQVPSNNKETKEENVKTDEDNENKTDTKTLLQASKNTI